MNEGVTPTAEAPEGQEPPPLRNKLGRSAKPAEKTLLQYLSVTISAAFLILISAVAILVVVVPHLVGGTALTVLTNSMAPRFPPGTLIVIKPTPIDEISIGSVLTYQIESGKPAVISHRVIERRITENGDVTFITKGDNNTDADPNPVTAIQVKGTLWFAIPGLGWVNNAVNGEARGIIVPIVAGLLFAYGAWTLVSSVRERRKRNRRRLKRLGGR